MRPNTVACASVLLPVRLVNSVMCNVLDCDTAQSIILTIKFHVKLAGDILYLC